MTVGDAMPLVRPGPHDPAPAFDPAFEALGMAMTAMGAQGRVIALRLRAGTAEPGEGRTLRRLVTRLREALRMRAVWARGRRLALDDRVALDDLAAMLAGFTPMIEAASARLRAARPEPDDLDVIMRVSRLHCACLALVHRLSREQQRGLASESAGDTQDTRAADPARRSPDRRNAVRRGRMRRWPMPAGFEAGLDADGAASDADDTARGRGFEGRRLSREERKDLELDSPALARKAMDMLNGILAAHPAHGRMAHLFDRDFRPIDPDPAPQGLLDDP